MSINEFVRKAEKNSKENIINAYRDIDFLYWQIELLQNQLNRYSNKTSGKSLSLCERLNEMALIRKSIPQVYKDLNYYKECINYERNEIKRINDTYGYSYKSIPYNEEKYIKLTNNSDMIYEDYEENKYDIFEDINEEITEYKYNSLTDTFE